MDDGGRMNYLDLINERQSCRNFDKTKSVKMEDIRYCLKAALLAPSACNSQPYKFTVATGETAFEVSKLVQNMNMNKFSENVPVMIVVSEGNYSVTAKIGSVGKEQDYRSIDIGIAVSQLCLAATEIGLSTCILGWFEEKKIKKLLKIDKRIRLVICFGYASEGEVLRKKVRKNFEEMVTIIEN